jgi:hypothetical protein
MRHRSHLPAQDRRARARLRKILGQNQPLVVGSLVETERLCGKPGCRCARGHKHKALYLGARLGRKRKMIFLPKERHAEVRRWVEDARAAQEAIDTISQAWLGRLEKMKQSCRDARK